MIFKCSSAEAEEEEDVNDVLRKHKKGNATAREFFSSGDVIININTLEDHPITPLAIPTPRASSS